MLPKSQIFNTENNLNYLLFETNDVISNHIRKFGYFDKNILTIAEFSIDHLSKLQPDGIVLDIGANMGTFTIPLAKKFDLLTFHSFEIQKPIYYQLCANALLNQLDNVEAHSFGLSDKNEIISINLPDYNEEGNIGMFSLKEEFNANCRGGNSIFSGKKAFINLKKLDDMNLKKIIFIKVDVEGMEIFVLKGAIATLVNNNFPPILYEAWSHEWFQERKEELDNFLISLGYKIHYFGDNAYAQHHKNGFLLNFSN
jgi:FkbM family methyltransferase